MTQHIDINADIGEMDSGNDAALMPYISSANIACGFHAGDAVRMRDAIAMCLAHDVAVGAHPSYWDREHFGRRNLDVPVDEIHAIVLYQIGALKSLTEAQGGRLRHVKPHGALYNRAAIDKNVADAIASAVRDADPTLALVGLAHSQSIKSGRAYGLRVLSEGFADRRYTNAGLLVPRSEAGAQIDSVDEAIAQALAMVQSRQVQSVSGKDIAMAVDSVCVHGDGAHALAFVKALQTALHKNNIGIQALVA